MGGHLATASRCGTPLPRRGPYTPQRCAAHPVGNGGTRHEAKPDNARRGGVLDCHAGHFQAQADAPPPRRSVRGSSIPPTPWPRNLAWLLRGDLRRLVIEIEMRLTTRENCRGPRPRPAPRHYNFRPEPEEISDRCTPPGEPRYKGYGPPWWQSGSYAAMPENPRELPQIPLDRGEDGIVVSRLDIDDCSSPRPRSGSPRGRCETHRCAQDPRPVRLPLGFKRVAAGGARGCSASLHCLQWRLKKCSYDSAVATILSSLPERRRRRTGEPAMPPPSCRRSLRILRDGCLCPRKIARRPSNGCRKSFGLL